MGAVRGVDEGDGMAGEEGEELFIGDGFDVGRFGGAKSFDAGGGKRGRWEWSGANDMGKGLGVEDGVGAGSGRRM